MCDTVSVQTSELTVGAEQRATEKGLSVDMHMRRLLLSDCSCSSVLLVEVPFVLSYTSNLFHISSGLAGCEARALPCVAWDVYRQCLWQVLVALCGLLSSALARMPTTVLRSKYLPSSNIVCSVINQNLEQARPAAIAHIFWLTVHQTPEEGCILSLAASGPCVFPQVPCNAPNMFTSHWSLKRTKARIPTVNQGYDRCSYIPYMST